MILTFDLDGVICTEEKTFERTLARPVPGAKECLQSLHQRGHTIIIESSRGWAEHKITKKWLADNGIVYDILVLGKPISDIRIDDKAIRFSDWDSVRKFVENVENMLPVQYPSDEYFLKENRRVIAEFLHEIANSELQEPILEIGPMEYFGSSVAARYPEYYVDTKQLFSRFDYRTMSPYGNADYIGDVSELASIFPANSIGTMIMMSVLEHVTTPWLFPAGAFNVLKHSGLLFLQIPWNLRFHGPRPDCWRISDDGLHALFDSYFDFVQLEQIQTPDRMLMPICLKAILRVKK